MVHEGYMSIPAGDITKNQTGPFSVAGGDTTHPIFCTKVDRFFTAIASTPNFRRICRTAHEIIFPLFLKKHKRLLLLTTGPILLGIKIEVSKGS
jgi:hypothetical protein